MLSMNEIKFFKGTIKELREHIKELLKKQTNK